MLGLAGTALAAAVVSGAAAGSVPISAGDMRAAIAAVAAGQPLQPEHVIFWNVRLPRVLLAALVGAALSLSGAAAQALFRNPLADPYVLGIASGAALGAALAFTFQAPWHAVGVGLAPAAAFAGALLALGLVYRLGTRGGRIFILQLLLAGVAVGTSFSALVWLVVLIQERRQHLASPIFHWLLGSLAGRDWIYLWAALPYFLLGAGILAWHARELNALLFGEEQALTLGVPVEPLKRRLAFASGLLTAVAVACAGVTGFVGLMIPHVARLLVGPDHRFLLPMAALTGGAFLVVADLLARVLLAPAEIPLGILTALAGGPFFLYLLLTGQREGGR